MQLTTTILLAILAASTALAAPVPASELEAHLEALAGHPSSITQHPTSGGGGKIVKVATCGGCSIQKSRPKPHGRRDLEDTVTLEARITSHPTSSGPKVKTRPHRRRDLEDAVTLEARVTQHPTSGKPKPVKPVKPSRNYRRRDLEDAVRLEARITEHPTSSGPRPTRPEPTRPRPTKPSPKPRPGCIGACVIMK